MDKAPDAYPAETLYEWKRRRTDELKIALSTPTFNTRCEARAHIEGPLAENAFIHRKYGPLGDPYVDGNPILWRRLARATIVPNNRTILRVIEANRYLLTEDEIEVVAALKVHVEQFERRHVLDDFTAGTDRFPEGAAQLLVDDRTPGQE